MATQMNITFFDQQDAAVLAGWFQSQREVTQWAGPGVNWPLTETFLATLTDSASQQPAWLLTFSARVEGQLAAVAQLGFDWDNHLACLCRIVVNPSMRGQGLAARLLRVLIDTAFKNEGIERIELHVYPFNQAAIKTYEKLGFVREGVRRACVSVGEERWDSVFYGLLRAEYAARSAA